MTEEIKEIIISILRARGASGSDIRSVERILKLWEEEKISSEDVYFYIIGLCREHFIPLTPRDVGDIRELLGLPRSRESYG